MTDSDKHFSLLRKGIIYDFKILIAQRPNSQYLSFFVTYEQIQ